MIALAGLSAGCTVPIARQSAASLSVPAPQQAQVAEDATPFDPAGARTAVEKLAQLLEENFIYPAVANSYAKMLRERLSSGAYSNFASQEEFAKQVTADLQAVHPEGHLSLMPASAFKPGGQVSGGVNAVHGPGKSGWLAPKVGYLAIHGFTGPRSEVQRLDQLLTWLASAETLIIDARQYAGGGNEGDVTFAHLFEKPTHLITYDVRKEVDGRPGANPFPEGPTIRTIDGPPGIVRRAYIPIPTQKPTNLKKARLFVLTSSGTISGGEAFAFALKNSGRATLIGERTKGSGHFGRTTQLGGGYRAFIPVGRPFDAKTNKGWEQTGVEPHINVPADKALEEAIRRAGINKNAAMKAFESFTVPEQPKS
ncbi:MAG TPA: S41 family peptidase [Allosphingosinicella sp.]|nr:S41 family peptidase [Allosphingosinicella sp.]